MEKSPASTLGRVASTFVAGLLTLGGVCLGSYLTYVNTAQLATEQRLRALRMDSYRQLAALEETWPQTLLDLQYARANRLFWDRRHEFLTHDDADRQRSLDEENRVHLTLSVATATQRELYECLAMVQVAFRSDRKLDQFIADYKAASRSVSIGEPQPAPKTEEELIRWFNETVTAMRSRANALPQRSQAIRTHIVGQVRADLNTR